MAEEQDVFLKLTTWGTGFSWMATDKGIEVVHKESSGYQITVFPWAIFKNCLDSKGLDDLRKSVERSLSVKSTVKG